MDASDVIRWRDRISKLNDELTAVSRPSGFEQAPGSPASLDTAAIEDSEPVATLVSQALLLLESVGEHVAAATDALHEPAKVMACFSCVRVAMEVASLSWWLLDPSLRSVERVSRSVALRSKGLSEQSKILRENPEWDTGKIPGRNAAIEERVLRHGLSRIVLPSTTELVAITFGDRAHYRLSSAVVHGHAWALLQIGFAAAEPHGNGVFVHKTAKPAVLVYVLMLALEAVSRSFWATSRYVGADVASVEKVLVAAHTDLRVRPNKWCWRQAG